MSWSDAANLTVDGYYGAAVSNDGETLAMVGISGNLRSSFDGGATWDTRAQTQGALYSVELSESNMLVAGGLGSLLVGLTVPEIVPPAFVGQRCIVGGSSPLEYLSPDGVGWVLVGPAGVVKATNGVFEKVVPSPSNTSVTSEIYAVAD